MRRRFSKVSAADGINRREASRDRRSVVQPGQRRHDFRSEQAKRSHFLFVGEAAEGELENQVVEPGDSGVLEQLAAHRIGTADDQGSGGARLVEASRKDP